jgi:hypothetical protein
VEAAVQLAYIQELLAPELGLTFEPAPASYGHEPRPARMGAGGAAPSVTNREDR